MPRTAPSAPSTMQLLGRWLLVGAVVIVVGYSAVKAAVEYFGSGDEAVAGVDDADGDAAGGSASDIASPSANSESATPSSDAVGASVDTVPVTTEPVTTEPVNTEPVNTGPPSPDNKATVYIVGDSDAGTFGPYLQELVDGTNVAVTELNYKVSSGLARPDFFDWPAELAATLPAVDPDIVVATFGGNDSQGLSAFQSELEWVVGDPLENEAAWTEEYIKRAGQVMDLLLEGDRTVIWVGIPNDDNPEVTAKLAIQDQAAKAAAAERPDVIFIDTWARFSGRDGNWAEFVIDPRDGEGKDVRADDGFHLNVTGAEILALDIAQVIRDDLRERGAAI